MTWLNTLHTTLQPIIDVFLAVFLLALVVSIITISCWYVIDVLQHSHTIRRNYPVIGRFRYFFEHLGEFFRQYFFSLDREELPFNRADRSWVYRAAKNVDRTIAFGSTRPLTPAGEVLFLNSAFPVSVSDKSEPQHKVIGAGFVASPYQPNSVFNISGMSYGALSKPAVRALSKGAAKAGVWMNTGEGGASPFHLESGCDVVFQIGTAKYGVCDKEGNLCEQKLAELAKLSQIKMFEIKLSQGAKPGKGGVLPAEKVTAEIAKIRGIEEGKASLSPNGHNDVHDVKSLLALINRVRNVVQKPVGIKMVLGQQQWLDDLFAEINQQGAKVAPDFITIDSADGGTGAAPQTLMDYVGLPIQHSLPLVADKLVEYGLRERVHLICSGKMVTPSAIAWALCMGADFVVSARGFMFALGCIQALQCNKNTCPTGITTHDKKLQKGLDVDRKAYRVASYVDNIQKELMMLVHSCGLHSPGEFNRDHLQVVTDHRQAVPMTQMYPYPKAADTADVIAVKK